MPNRPKTHWSTLFAVGLPLLAGGCVSTESTNYMATTPPELTPEQVANMNPMVLAQKLSTEKNYASAAVMYRQAHTANPGDPVPLIGLGDSLLAVGANAEAADAFSRALAIDGDNGKALSGLGNARILLGQPQYAIPQFQLAAQINPRDIRALNGLGVAQDMSGDHAGAQKTYRAALAIDPANQAAKNNLALSLALSGDNAGAIKTLEEIANSPTASAVNRQNLALVYGVSGQLEKAEELSRADLPDQAVRQNMKLLGRQEASSAERLKSALGVELKGMQYTPAPRPAMQLSEASQPVVDDAGIYIASSNGGGDMPSVVSVKAASVRRTASGGVTIAPAADDEDWAEDWDEELVEATEPGADESQVVELNSQPATAPLPPVPTRGAPAVAATAPAAVDPDTPGASQTASLSTASTPASTRPLKFATTSAVSAAEPATQSSAPAAATPKPTEVAGVVAPAQAPASAPAPAAIVHAQPAQQTASAEPSTVVTTVPSPSPSKVYNVQLASYRSEAEASAGWQALTTDYGDLLKALPHHVEKADLGADKGIYFRLKAGSFADVKAAKSLCKDLEVRSIDCMVVEGTQASTAAAPGLVQESRLTPTGALPTRAR